MTAFDLTTSADLRRLADEHDLNAATNPHLTDRQRKADRGYAADYRARADRMDGIAPQARRPVPYRGEVEVTRDGERAFEYGEVA